MECSVHSPCGRYVVSYRNAGDTLHINAVPKPVAVEPGAETIHYIAVLGESHIAEISAAAGVRKDFTAFSDMIYNAMIGRSPCVRFFIETCSEMRTRIATEVAQRQHASKGPGVDEEQPANTSMDDSGSGNNSLLSEPARSQWFFTLDYDVDFTRAMFPVPLVATEGGANSNNGERQTGLVRAAGQQQQQHGVAAIPNCAPAAVKSDDNEVAKWRTENEKLRRENDALTRLCKEKMLEMQRLCEDFQLRVETVKEVERLKKKLVELRTRATRAEEERDEAQAALARIRREHQRLQRSRTPQGRIEHQSEKPTRQRSRFDTPPVVRGRPTSRGGARDSPLLRRLSSGRKQSHCMPRNRSASSEGLTVTKRRLWNGSGSSGPPSRSSSCGSCERLYRSPTASSSQRERCTAKYFASRAVFF